MNKTPNLSIRKSRPQTVGGAIGALLRMFGRHASDADLAASWDEILGPELSGMAKLVSISKLSSRTSRSDDPGPGQSGRTITVRATVPAMKTVLNYRTDDIRTRVNKYFGYDAIGTVRIK